MENTVPGQTICRNDALVGFVCQEVCGWVGSFSMGRSSGCISSPGINQMVELFSSVAIRLFYFLSGLIHGRFLIPFVQKNEAFSVVRPLQT